MSNVWDRTAPKLRLPAWLPRIAPEHNPPLSHLPLPSWMPSAPWQAGIETEIAPSGTGMASASAIRGAIRANLGDKWLLIGTTGCGKTTAGKKITGGMRRLWPQLPRYFIDSKAMGDFAEYGEAITSQDPPPPSRLRNGVQVWQPPRDILACYDAFFEQLVKGRKPCIVFVDELSSIGGRKGDTYPDNFIRALKQGRGIGIVMVILSQAVQAMPHEVLDQISHILRFRLQSPYGGHYIDFRMLGVGRSLEPAAKHGFAYIRPGSNPLQVVEYDDIGEFLGQRAA